MSQAEELLRNEKGRKYADGAAETLQQALTEQRAVLSRVNGMSRDSMTDAQTTAAVATQETEGDTATVTVSIADAELLAAYYNGTRQLAQVQLAAADHQTKADIRCSCIGLYPQLSEGGRRLELHGHRRIL